MAKKQGKVFVISGPSAVGKSTVVSAVLKKLTKKYDIERVITYTSRPPREGEVEGEDYFFISGQDFSQKEKEGFFLETTEYMRHRRGSPVPSQEELELGKSFIFIVDIDGSKSIPKLLRDKADIMSVWIDPPNMLTLRARMKKRGSETEKEVERRLAKAEDECEEAHKIRLFDYYLVSDVFDRAVEELSLLITRELG
jgi:guanylate kinase